MRFSDLTSLTSKELDALLDGQDDLTEETDNPESVNAISSDQGPGYLNKWSLLKGNDGAWQKLEPVNTTKSRRKIIICNPIQARFAPTEEEAIFIAALIEHCDVYLWPKNPIQMTEIERVPSTNYFWENRAQIKSTTTAIVQKALAEQGINIHDYYILDLFNYQKNIIKLDRHYIKSKDIYSLTIPEYFEGLLHSGNYLNIPDLKKHLSEKDFNEFIAEGINYPQLQHVLIDNLQDLDLIQPKSLSNIDILIKNAPVTSLNLLKNKTIKGIYYINTEENTQIVTILKIPNIIGLKTFAIAGITTQYLDLSECHECENIHFHKIKELREVTLPQVAHLKRLDIGECEKLKKIKMSSVIEVGFLSYFYEHHELINLSSLKKIEELRVKNNQHLPSTNSELKNMNLSDLEVNVINLDSSHFSIILPNKGLKKFSNLSSSLEIKTIKPLKDLISFRFLAPSYPIFKLIKKLSSKVDFNSLLSNASNLKSVKLSNTDITILDLSNSKELSTLELYLNSNLELLKLNPNLNLKKFTLDEPNKNLKIQNSENAFKAKEVTVDNWKLIQDHTINIDHNSIESLRLTKYSNDSDPDKHLDLSSLNNLKYFNGVELSVGYISFSENSKLISINFATEHDSLTELDLTNCHHLQNISVDSDNLELVTFSKIAKPQFITFDSYNVISCVDLNSEKLVAATIANSDIDNLNELKSSNLRRLTISSIQHNTDKINLAKIFPNISSIQFDSDIHCFNLSECHNLRHINYTIVGPANNDEEFSYPAIIHPAEHAEVYILSVNSEYPLPELQETDKSLPIIQFEQPQPNIRIFYLDNLPGLKKFDFDSIPNVLSFHASDSNDVIIPANYLEKLSHRGFTIQTGQHSSHSLTPQYKQRNISRLNLYNDTLIDGTTNDNNLKHHANGSFYCEVISKRKISIDHHRISFFNRFELNDDTLKLKLAQYNQDEVVNCEDQLFDLSETNINELIYLAKTSDHPGEILGHVFGEISPNQWHPLPLSCTGSFYEHTKFYINSNAKERLILCWSESHKQYGIYFNSNDITETLEIDIYYPLIQNLNYRNKKLIDSELLFELNETLLPSVLGDELAELVDTHDELSYLFNPNLTPQEQLRFIYDYCSHFQNKDLENSNDEPTIDTLLTIIDEKKGVCRHRSFAFMALTHLVNIPSRIIYNEQHAFVEVPYKTESGTEWLGLDLGGGALQDLTNEHDFDIPNRPDPATLSPQNEIKLFTPQFNTEISRHTILSKQEQGNAFKYAFTCYAEKREIKDLNDLLKPSKLAPLIIINNPSDALKIDRLLFQYLTSQHANVPYLYINDPIELKQFYDSMYFDNNGRHLNQHNGILKNFISNPGVLLINWSTFNAAQIAAYKSCLDTIRKLFGHSIHPHLVILGTISTETPACSAFYSRCLTYTLSSTLLESNSALDNKIETTNPFELDFFNQPIWEETFYGPIKFEGSAIRLEKSSLIQAIEAGKSITLYNLPSLPEIDLQLHRLRTHGKIYYNGKFITAKPGFTFNIASRTHTNHCENICVLTSPNTNFENIMIGMHNIYSLYSQLRVEEPKAFDDDGLLSSIDCNSQQFYIVDSIPDSQWQYLVYTIKTRYPNKQFTFLLAPGISAGGLTGETQENQQKINTAHVSNDPDFHAESLRKSDASNSSIIYPVTNHTTFSSIIYTITPKCDKELSFKTDIQFVLNELSNGRTVILTGNINQQLATELLTLLQDNPYYTDNKNNRIPVTGKLKLVLPLNHGLTLNILAETHYSIIDYPWSKEDLEWIEKIKHFYLLANQALELQTKRNITLPHSYQLIKTMIARLKSPALHPHNPIKGLLLFNYPIDSDTYALLNIIGKYVFSPIIIVPINIAKLSKLINRLKDLSSGELDLDRFYFRILNCFSGKALHYIIGNDITAIFNPLTPNLDVNKRFYAEVTRFYNPDFRDILSSKTSNSQQLLKLIQNEATPLIILKGAPGVGKTFTVRQLKTLNQHIRLFEGSDAIEQWLSSTLNGEVKVLLLDEANMALPGSWDFLKGLCLSQRSVIYNGKVFKLTDEHKIIAAVNPDDFPGRHIHPFFQHYGETIYFKPANKYFLSKIISNLIKFNATNFYRTPDVLHNVYKLYITYQPYMAISIRDLESLTSRYCALIQLDATHETALYQACINEFSYAISDTNKRFAFINDINKIFNQNNIAFNAIPTDISLHQFSNNYYLPTPKFHLANIIEQDIHFRELNIESEFSTNTRLIKRGILLEGDSGAGKSTLFLKILEKNGYAEHHPDSRRRFYHFSALDLGIEDNLNKAFHEGTIVVLDELDLNPGLERVLNHYLTGVDTHGLPPRHPGFMLLASQNGAQFIGRFSTPSALANRLHFMRIDAYSDAELIAIANRVVSNPQAFVAAYRETQRLHPGIINMRTFYTVLGEEEQRQQLKKQRLLQRDNDQDNLSDYLPLFKRNKTEKIDSNIPSPDAMDIDEIQRSSLSKQ